MGELHWRCATPHVLKFPVRPLCNVNALKQYLNKKLADYNLCPALRLRLKKYCKGLLYGEGFDVHLDK